MLSKNRPSARVLLDPRVLGLTGLGWPLCACDIYRLCARERAKWKKTGPAEAATNGKRVAVKTARGLPIHLSSSPHTVTGRPAKHASLPCFDCCCPKYPIWYGVATVQELVVKNDGRARRCEYGRTTAHTLCRLSLGALMRAQPKLGRAVGRGEADERQEHGQRSETPGLATIGVPCL